MPNANRIRGLLAVALGCTVWACSGAFANEPTQTPVPRPTDMAALATPVPAAPASIPASDSDTTAPAEGTTGARVGPVTGFPLPRYVSMKASEANIRRGPSRSHRIDWVFQRRGMPMMVVAEHGHWRRVIDRDGVGGWIHYTLLSGVRTAIVEADMLPMYQRPDQAAPVRANAERGVIGRLRECRPDWCLMEAGGYRGWVEVSALWGVDPGEEFD